MAGFVEVDLDDVYRGLDAMVRAGQDLRPVFRGLRPDLRKDLRDHGAERAGPEGGWPPPSASTIARALSVGGERRNVARRGTIKRRAARRLAKQLGRLPTSFKVTFERGAIIGTSLVRWSGIHQDGGVAGHHASIPARPFAWASEGLLGVVAERVVDYIAGQF